MLRGKKGESVVFQRSNGVFSAEEIAGLRAMRLAIKVRLDRHRVEQIGTVRPIYDEEGQFKGIVWKPAHEGPYRWQGVPLQEGKTLEKAIDGLFHRLNTLIECVNLFIPTNCEPIEAGDWAHVANGIGATMEAICDRR